jgi:hypothetical protein
MRMDKLSKQKCKHEYTIINYGSIIQSVVHWMKFIIISLCCS